MSEEKYRDVSVMNLSMQCMVECQFSCDKCPTFDNYQAESDEASEAAYDRGWRATNNHTYCPKCAKKYLKK